MQNGQGKFEEADCKPSANKINFSLVLDVNVLDVLNVEDVVDVLNIKDNYVHDNNDDDNDVNVEDIVDVQDVVDVFNVNTTFTFRTSATSSTFKDDNVVDDLNVDNIVDVESADVQDILGNVHDFFDVQDVFDDVDVVVEDEARYDKDQAKLDNSRRIVEAHCTCRGGTCGQCKHAAAVVAYVNKEDTSTKTSITNVWKRPSAKQLGIYNKGVPFSEMYTPKLPDGKLRGQPVPASIVDSNCPLGIMLRQEAQVKENLAGLDKLLQQLGPDVIFGAQNISCEEVCDDILLQVMVSQDECKDIAKYTMLQSACPQWHHERAARISASSKAHRIKIRTADFETLAKDLATPRSFKSAACAYGIEKEPEARREYESLEKHKVIQVGLVCAPQPWLCYSPDGLVEEDGEIRLLEIKCPSRCEAKPVVNRDINLQNVQPTSSAPSHRDYCQLLRPSASGTLIQTLLCSAVSCLIQTFI
ncbi:hypothetical protein ISCGN_002290 [Ixodes scapularis]